MSTQLEPAQLNVHSKAHDDVDQGSTNIELQDSHSPSSSTNSTLNLHVVQSSAALQPVTKGRQRWVLISAFLTLILTVGSNQSYGTFQVAYTSADRTILPEAQAQNKALVAFIGTLAGGLTWAGSAFVNPAMARIKNVRWITASGAILMSVGLLSASFSSQIWHLLVTQGFLYGTGCSMLYYPILAAAPEYFDTNRGVAMGFIFSGGGLGAVIFSPLTQATIDKIGVKWTLRLLALITFATATPIGLSAVGSRFPGRRPTHVSWETAKKPTFLLSVTAAVLLSTGNGIPLTFLSEYSVSLGYSAAFGAALISVNNAVNALSRIFLGFLGDKIGRQNALNATIFGSAIAVIAFWLPSVKTASKEIWLAFVVVYGIWAGGYSSLYPTTIVDVFGIQAYASVNGFVYMARGFATMLGSPVAGALLTASKKKAEKEFDGTKEVEAYSSVVYFNAAMMFGASVCITLVRYFHAREKGTFKLKA